MQEYDRPLFATVGRVRVKPGERRSRFVLLVVVTGLTAATLAFVYELRARERTTVVEAWLDLPLDPQPTPLPPLPAP